MNPIDWLNTQKINPNLIATYETNFINELFAHDNSH